MTTHRCSVCRNERLDESDALCWKCGAAKDRIERLTADLDSFEKSLREAIARGELLAPLNDDLVLKRENFMVRRSCPICQGVWYGPLSRKSPCMCVELREWQSS